MAPIPAVSVIVPVHNGGAPLVQQLQALAVQDFDEPWELIVVDNRSTDDTLAVVAGCAPEARVVSAPDRPSAGYARNTGAEVASAPILAFCDADDVVRPGWLRALVVRVRATDTLVVGGFDVRPLNSAIPRQALPADGIIAASGSGPFRKGGSGNMAIPANLFRALGGFACLPGAVCEDKDLCWRVQHAGKPLIYEDDALVDIRLRPGSFAAFRQRYVYGRESVILFRRHHSHGLPRDVGTSLRGWLAVLVHLPWLFSPKRRLWFELVGYRLGRLRGSLKYRALYI